MSEAHENPSPADLMAECGKARSRWLAAMMLHALAETLTGEPDVLAACAASCERLMQASFAADEAYRKDTHVPGGWKIEGVVSPLQAVAHAIQRQDVDQYASVAITVAPLLKPSQSRTFHAPSLVTETDGRGTTTVKPKEVTHV